MVINLAIGGGFFPPNLYGTFTPQDAANWADNTYQIDYIRVYQRGNNAVSSAIAPPVSSAPSPSDDPRTSAVTSTPRITSRPSSNPASSVSLSDPSDDLGSESSNIVEFPAIPDLVPDNLDTSESIGTTDPLIGENLLAVNEQQSEQKILGFPKPVVAGVGAGIGLLIVVVVVAAVVFYRRRTKKEAVEMTEVAAPVTPRPPPNCRPMEQSTLNLKLPAFQPYGTHV